LTSGDHRQASIVVGGVFLVLSVASWAYVPARHPPLREALVVVTVVGLVGAGSIVAAILSVVRHRSLGYVIVYGAAGIFLLVAELYLLVRVHRLRRSLGADGVKLGGYAREGDLPSGPDSDQGKS
jgi:hypothetical protein